jgi:hypothetical protein
MGGWFHLAARCTDQLLVLIVGGISSSGNSGFSYTAVAALFTIIGAVGHELFKNRLRRKGIARLLYYRLLECQSTLAIAYYSKQWWSQKELRGSYLEEDDDVKRVATALYAHEWRVVHSVLGWTEHLRDRQRREGDGHEVAQADLDRIRSTYERLELARWSLCRVCAYGTTRIPLQRGLYISLPHGKRIPVLRGMPWDVHNHEGARTRAEQEGYALPAEPLENLSKEQCREQMELRKRDDAMPRANLSRQATRDGGRVRLHA